MQNRGRMVACALLLYPAASAAEIYRCVDAQGRVTFAQTRCSAGARLIEPSHSEPARPAVAEPAAGSSRPDDATRSAARETREREALRRREQMRALAHEADRWQREAARSSASGGGTGRGRAEGATRP